MPNHLRFKGPPSTVDEASSPHVEPNPHPTLPTLERHRASVLLTFRAENVRSFRDPVELSMLADGLAEVEAIAHLPWQENGHPVGVLPVAGILGANVSGKTAILQATADMRHHVLYSFRTGNPLGGITRTPFRLDPQAAAKPSTFEVDLVLDGVRHEYGFCIDDHRVIAEWAYHYPHGKASLLFRRDGDDVTVGRSGRTTMRPVTNLLRPNALFLSTAGTTNNPTLLPLFTWFAHNLQLDTAESRPMRQALPAELLNDPQRRDLVVQMLHVADLGITSATTHPTDPHRHAPVPTYASLTHHGAGGEIAIPRRDESRGTLAWANLIAWSVHAIAQGSTLLVDDLAASLHPHLVAHLIRMFQRPESNPHTAQLILTTHHSTFLVGAENDRPIGNDQVWLTEKNPDGNTRLLPLSSLKPHEHEDMTRRYRAGRYGGTPIISTTEFDTAAEHITSRRTP